MLLIHLVFLESPNRVLTLTFYLSNDILIALTAINKILSRNQREWSWLPLRRKRRQKYRQHSSILSELISSHVQTQGSRQKPASNSFPTKWFHVIDNNTVITLHIASDSLNCFFFPFFFLPFPNFFLGLSLNWMPVSYKKNFVFPLIFNHAGYIKVKVS